MTDSHQRGRKTVAVLLVVAAVLTFVAIFSFWANRQAMNTDRWTSPHQLKDLPPSRVAPPRSPLGFW